MYHHIEKSVFLMFKPMATMLTSVKAAITKVHLKFYDTC